MRKTAIALIDYDNLDAKYRSNHTALEHEIYTNVSKIDTFDEIAFRLYGGWDENLKSTNSAITLAPWVHSFPKAINKTILSADLARSLAFETHNLPWTFRRRTRKTLISVDNNKICKKDNSCDLYKLDQILKNVKCQKPTCAKEFKEALLVSEQKLIDSMISIDLLYYAENKCLTIILVSSDDDFIPAIRWAGYKGNTIYVLHTANSSYQYKAKYTENYDHLIKQRGMMV